MPEVSKYRLIADDLREKVLTGHFDQNEGKLPTETELMEAWDAARTTVRKALAVLAAEGLTESRKGSGVRVRDIGDRRALRGFKPVIRVETTRSSAWKLGHSLWELDVERGEPTPDQMEIGYVTAPEPVARVIDTFDAGLRFRRYHVEGRPALLSKSYLPAEIVRGTRIMQPDTGPGGIYARLRDLGFEVAGFSMQVWAREATSEEIERLALAGPLPFVMCGVRTAFTETGRAVEVNEMAMNPPMFVEQFEWDA